ncbi:MAG TPA: thioredoxin domain-containing protein [Allosphingosinicella sp.]|nr:thioredoxin domain-containing protein [Allosphingosinicella sp.]
MKLFLTGGVAALALLAAGCNGDGTNASSGAPAAELKQIPAPNGDWTQMVVKTPEGGFRMGNPDAPVKLVEYGSLSCPHCAEFEEQGAPALRDRYVKSGQVSWEFRTYLLFPTDPGVSMLLHCQGEGSAFPMIEQLYKTQGEWMEKIRALPAEQLQALATMPAAQAAPMTVQAAGLDEFFRQRGMPASKIQACLADTSRLEMFAQIKKRGDEEGVNGTPSFFVNASRVDAGTWAGLEGPIRSAIPK